MREDYARDYAELYRKHWWWRARESIVLREIERLGLTAPVEILDVGCGAGLLLRELSRWGPVAGIETDASLLGPDIPYRTRIRTEPLGSPRHERGKYDLITALDVLEHFENDDRAVADTFELLAPGGKLLVTVPAFPCLWDAHDVMNRHYRRYTKPTLRALLSRHGRVVRARYLFHSLFPLKYAVAKINRGRDDAIVQHRIPVEPLNRLLALWCRAEHHALSWLPLPLGTSVLAVAEKPPRPG